MVDPEDSLPTNVSNPVGAAIIACTDSAIRRVTLPLGLNGSAIP